MMIERFISKAKWPLDRLKAILTLHSDWQYVVSEYPTAWHIKLDRGGETLDAELQEHEAYPDPRLAYLVEVGHVDVKAGKVKVKRGSHERSVDASTSKQVGQKAVLIFLEGDRSKPVIIA
jgi:hypothetical protein